MSCDAGGYDFTIRKGKTFSYVVRWESGPVRFLPIESLTCGAPTVITSTAHGLVDGWRVAIETVKGPRIVNAPHNPPRQEEYHKITLIDADTFSIPVNTSGQPAYKGDGIIRTNTAASLAGCTARMQIRTSTNGTLLHTMTTENGGIVLDDVLKTVELYIADETTAGFTWRSAVYDLEIETALGEVFELLHGGVTARDEVTV